MSNLLADALHIIIIGLSVWTLKALHAHGIHVDLRIWTNGKEKRKPEEP